MSDVLDFAVEYQNRREEVLRRTEFSAATRSLLLETLMQEQHREIGSFVLPVSRDPNVIDAIAGWVRPTPPQLEHGVTDCQVCGAFLFGRQSKRLNPRSQDLVDRHHGMHAKEASLRKKYPGLITQRWERDAIEGDTPSTDAPRERWAKWGLDALFCRYSEYVHEACLIEGKNWWTNRLVLRRAPNVTFAKYAGDWLTNTGYQILHDQVHPHRLHALAEHLPEVFVGDGPKEVQRLLEAAGHGFKQ